MHVFTACLKMVSLAANIEINTQTQTSNCIYTFYWSETIMITVPHGGCQEQHNVLSALITDPWNGIFWLVVLGYRLEGLCVVYTTTSFYSASITNCCFRYIIILSTLDSQLAKCSNLSYNNKHSRCGMSHKARIALSVPLDMILKIGMYIKLTMHKTGVANMLTWLCYTFCTGLHFSSFSCLACSLSLRNV